VSKYIFGGLIIALFLSGLAIKYLFDEWSNTKAKLETSQSEVARLVKEKENQEKVDKQVDVVMDTHHEEKVKIVYVDKIITKQVVEYRERNPDACRLDSKWVRIHNDAATGVPQTEDKQGTLGKDAGAADALEVVTDNYSLYRQCRARLHALQEVISVSY
jgi:hypothetical protein